MMTRAVPASVVLHAMAFAALLLWGDRVTTQAAHVPSVIAVRLVEASVRESQSAPPAPEVKAEPVPEPEPVKPDVVRPPKDVPREKPKEKPKDKPKPAVTPPSTATGPPKPEAGVKGTTTGAAGLTGPAVSGTDSDFPFAWYLQAVESKVVASWKPRQLGFGDRAIVSCSVHFVINRAGVVSQVRLVRNSGLGVFDREAVRAVQTTRLPPLPPQYRGTDLGVTFDFNLEPGSQ
jgi:protein TonB